jgi:hypothetical protein
MNSMRCEDSSMFNRKKRVVPAGAKPNAPPSVSRAQRLSAMGKEARARLATWALDDSFQDTNFMFHKEYEKLGYHDGVGVFLRLAALDIRGTGSVPAEEERLF